MKSYIPLETAAIFFLANLDLKQGISSEYDMVAFGLLDLWWIEKHKMKNSCPQWDSNPGPSAYEANALSVELLELINSDHLKVTTFDLSVLLIVTCTCGRYSKMFCRVIHLNNSLHSANVLISQTATRYKYYMIKTRQIIVTPTRLYRQLT